MIVVLKASTTSKGCCRPILNLGAIFIFSLHARASEQGNWASEASPTLGCSIEISRGMSVGMYVCMSVVVQKA